MARKFSSDAERKAAMANMNNGGKGINSNDIENGEPGSSNNGDSVNRMLRDDDSVSNEVFVEQIFETAFGINALERDFSKAEVLEKIREFSDTALIVDEPKEHQEELKNLIEKPIDLDIGEEVIINDEKFIVELPDDEDSEFFFLRSLGDVNEDK